MTILRAELGKGDFMGFFVILMRFFWRNERHTVPFLKRRAPVTILQMIPKTPHFLLSHFRLIILETKQGYKSSRFPWKVLCAQKSSTLFARILEKGIVNGCRVLIPVLDAAKCRYLLYIPPKNNNSHSFKWRLTPLSSINQSITTNHLKCVSRLYVLI